MIPKPEIVNLRRCSVSVRCDTLTQYYELFEKVQAEKQQQDEAQGRLFKPLHHCHYFLLCCQ